MHNNPSWLNKKETTRSKSSKQEKSLSKKFGGKTTSNSGAVFGENDIKTREFEIEAKTTDLKGYRLTLAELNAIRNKCRIDKTPLQIIEFRGDASFVVINLTDFLSLIEKDSL